LAYSVTQLKDWFGQGSRKVESKEMMDFWKSLSDKEMEEFKNAELS